MTKIDPLLALVLALTGCGGGGGGEAADNSAAAPDAPADAAELADDAALANAAAESEAADMEAYGGTAAAPAPAENAQ